MMAGTEAALVVRQERPPLLPGADEIFRGVYTRAGLGATSEIVGVCSAIVGEGKSTVALGLAVTIAQDFPDRRVLLAETDLHNPVLAGDFDLEQGPGLTECLLAVSALELAARPTHMENLDLLPAGGPADGVGRLLRSAQMATLTDAMRQAYDTIILDLPALLVNSDSLILSDLADVLIFVVRAGVTPASVINKALEQVDETKLRGLVLNDSRSSAPGWLRRACGL
jgi:capsular exopolysaccharide synthesis family protein